MIPAEGLVVPPEKTIGLGRPMFARFSKLKDSARNSSLVLSEMEVALNKERSRVAKPGPRNIPRPASPKVPGVGNR